MCKPYSPVGRPVAQTHQWWLVDLAHTIGPAAAARLVGVTRGTLAAVIAGLPVSAATDARVRRAHERAA